MGQTLKRLGDKETESVPRSTMYLQSVAALFRHVQGALVRWPARTHRAAAAPAGRH